MTEVRNKGENMKIVYTNMPMQKVEKTIYKAKGNEDLLYSEAVSFPVISLLAKNLKKDDAVKIVMIVNKNETADRNSNIFEKEIELINAHIGAKIVYEKIELDFVEDVINQQKRYRQIIGTFELGAEIYADITYGQKALPLVLFMALHFGEMYFDIDIKIIMYGKVEFKSNQIVKDSAEIFDLTSLFYLERVTESMNPADEKQALQQLDSLLSI